MKMMKKVLASVAAAVLAFGMMAVSAFAADGDYYVSGSTTDWNESDYAPFSAYWSETGDAMTDEGNGIYSITFTDVAPGEYALKVTDGTWDNSWGTDGGNYVFTLEETSDVKITFDSATKTVSSAVVTEEDTGAEDTETGDASHAAVWVVLAAVAVVGAGALFVTRKKVTE